MGPSGVDIARSADAVSAFLQGTDPELWSNEIPELGWTVSEAVAHAAEGCLWYAIDLAAGGLDLQTVAHSVRSDRPSSELIATVRTYASILIDVVEAVPANQRGFHPQGLADPSGFAAMGCDELLVHTWDAARGLGMDFFPPPHGGRGRPTSPLSLDGERSRSAVAEAPCGPMVESNSRINLGSSNWKWHCLPLSEWDGLRP